MNKPTLILLSLITLATLVVLIIALTQPTSAFYPYRLVIGICLLVFGGLLRRHILRYRDDSK
ncbi:MAG TPA: hypothetical protein PKN96_03265 [Flavobacterium sp.]|uniref:hypothetical protein n=1 Tax=Flavobacterium sp. TaxID=239 RepID=UPI002C9BB833|nr:hypothetical protein [Flavobacterium sp.]HNP32291.1 hypothetical protein [Flavobacterium sp.]